MMNNSTLENTTTTYTGCTVNRETVRAAWFYTDLVTSLMSFVGNILLIVVVYRTRTIRTSTDYFVVSMASSDIFLPVLNCLFDIIFHFSGYVSQMTGLVLCKLIFFFVDVSYGVSILSLTVITVYRFYAVAFPMRARVHSRRTCIMLLLFTWVLALAMSSPWLFLVSFSLNSERCYTEISTHYSRLWNTMYFSFFFLLPLLVMLLLYPMIIVRLRRQKIPGSANCSQAAITRRKQNFRVTTMFITLTVAFVVCWGSFIIMYLIFLFSLVRDRCTFDQVYSIVRTFPVVFHAINPMIYFIFCSSYRQGIKQLLSCCCRRTHVHQAPGGNQIELGDIPQVHRYH